MVKKASSLSALGGLVYSTDTGRHCPDCHQPIGACICKQAEIPAGDGIARVRRETKGRGGKTVTTVTGVPLAADALKDLATALKKRCGKLRQNTAAFLKMRSSASFKLLQMGNISASTLL